MTFKLEIHCDNAAFHGRPQTEVAHILRKIAVVDTNGNKVGQYAFKGKQPQ